MNTLFRYAALGAAALAMAACGSLENPPLVTAGAPVGEIVVVNQSSHTLLDVSIVPARTDGRLPNDYGFDRLDGETVPVGGERAFAASAGCYSIRTVTGPDEFFTLTRDEQFGSICVQANTPAYYYVSDPGM